MNKIYFFWLDPPIPLTIHTGVMTYESGPYSSANDVTLSKGVNSYGKIKWKTTPYELSTPHKVIIIDIGQ